MKLIAPLRIQVSKKKHFALNLNVFRNSHYMTLNKAKVNFKATMTEQINQLPELNRITVHYVLYPKTKRRTDLGNVISVVKKFLEDALVELGKLPDDDYTHIIGSSESFGAVDKHNPRVEIIITKC